MPRARSRAVEAHRLGCSRAGRGWERIGLGGVGELGGRRQQIADHLEPAVLVHAPAGDAQRDCAGDPPGRAHRHRDAMQTERRLVDVLGVAAPACGRKGCAASSLSPPRCRPVGVVSSAPPYMAATSASGRSASITRPDAEANAGSRLPTDVTSRTGWVVSCLAMNTLSEPSSIVRHVVSLCRSRSPRATLVEAGGQRRGRSRARQPGHARTELDVAAARVASDPTSLPHRRAHPVERALGHAGLARQLRERHRAAAIERVEDVEDRRDTRRTATGTSRGLLADHGRYCSLLDPPVERCSADGRCEPVIRRRKSQVYVVFSLRGRIGRSLGRFGQYVNRNGLDS